MNAKINWHDHHAYGSGTLSSGYCEAARFLILFRHSADGRCITLKRDGEYAGSYQTVGAAKRGAGQIVKRLSSQTKPAATSRTLTVTLSTDSAAFEDRSEIARCLRQVEADIEYGSNSSGSIRDSNGNTVGQWTIDIGGDK